MARLVFVAALLMPRPAAAQRAIFTEGLRELTRTMLATAKDGPREQAALDKMAAGLEGWNDASAFAAGNALLGEDAAEFPALPLAAYADGFAHILHGEYREAIAALRRAAAVTTDERSLLVSAGTLAREGREDDAERALRSIVAAFPRSAVAHWWLARISENLNRASDARREYETAAAVALTGRAPLYAAIGRTSRAEGNFARAAEAYEERARLTPNDPAAHKDLAWIYLEQDRRDAALTEYEEARRLNPRDGETHAALGRILLDAGRPLEAVAALRQAVELLPEVHETRYTLAMALRRAGEPEAAARELALFERAAQQALAERRRQMAADVAKEEGARRAKPR